MSIEVLKIPLAGAGQVEVRVGLNGNLALVKTAIDLGKGVILKQVKKSAEGIYKRGNWKTKIVTAPILLNMKKGEYKAFVDSIHDIGSWLNAVRKETDQNAENNALVSQEISVSEGYDLIRGATGGDEIAGIIGNLFGSAPKSLLEWDKKGFEKNQSYYAYKGKAEEIINIGKLISAVFKKGLYSGNSLGYKIYNYAQAKTCPVRAFISDKGHLLFRKANGKFKVFDWKGISSPKDRNFKTLFALNDFNYNENKKGNFVFKDEKQDLFMFDANGQAIKLYDHLRGKFVNTPASPVGKTESIPTPNIIRKKAYELDKSIDSMITKIKEQRLVEIDEISAVKDDIKNLKELVLPDINSQGEVSSITMDAALAEAASKGMTEEKLKTILSGHTKPTQKEQLYIDLIDNLDVNRMSNFRKQLGLTEGEIYRFKQIIQGAEKALENYKPSLFDIAGPKVMADAVGFSGNLISGFAAASNSTVGGLSTQGIMAPLTAVWYIIGRTVPYLTATTAGLVTKYIFEKITGMDLASVIFHPVVTYRYMKNINRIKERWDWELEQADEDKNLVNWFGEDFLQEKLYSDEEEEAPKKKKRRISKKTKSRQAKKNKPEPEVNLADSVDIFKQEDDIPIEEPDPYFIEEPVFTKKKKAQPEVNLADGVDIFKQEDDIPMEEPDPYFIEEPVVNYSDHRDEPKPKTDSNLIKKDNSMGLFDIAGAVIGGVAKNSDGWGNIFKQVAQGAAKFGVKKVQNYLNRSKDPAKRAKWQAIKNHSNRAHTNAASKFTKKAKQGLRKHTVEYLDDSGNATGVYADVQGEGPDVQGEDPTNVNINPQQTLSLTQYNGGSLIPSGAQGRMNLVSFFKQQITNAFPVIGKLFNSPVGRVVQAAFNQLSESGKIQLFFDAAKTKAKNISANALKYLRDKIMGNFVKPHMLGPGGKSPIPIEYKEPENKGTNMIIRPEHIEKGPGGGAVIVPGKEVKKQEQVANPSNMLVINDEDMGGWHDVKPQEVKNSKIVIGEARTKQKAKNIGQQLIANFEELEPRIQVEVIKVVEERDPVLEEVVNFNVYRAPKQYYQCSPSAYYGGRTLASLPQNLLESYYSLVYKAKMEGTLPTDPTEKTSVAVYHDTGLDGPEPMIGANNDIDTIANEPDMVQVVAATDVPMSEVKAVLPTSPASADLSSVAPSLVAVNGNSKVMRCLRCNTFVSVSKTHSIAECDSRIRKFGEKKGKRSSTTSARKARVDRSLLKVYRAQERNYANLTKKAKSLCKKYAKKGKIPKEVKKFLDKFSYSKK